MKVFVALWVLVTALVAAGMPANAGEYSLANRPEVVFKNGPVRVSPYPQSKRAALVRQSDTCWRDCTSACTWKMEYCVGSSDADSCRPHLDACDRSCQRSCRGITAGPLLGFIDF